jgi:serine/threonine protein kinase
MMIGKSPYQEDIIKIAQNQIPPELSQLKFPVEIELTSEAKDFLSSMLNLDPFKRLGIA